MASVEGGSARRGSAISASLSLPHHQGATAALQSPGDIPHTATQRCILKGG